MFNRNKKIFKYCGLSILLLSLVILGIYYLKPVLISINKYGLQSVLSSYESKAKYIYFLICFLQPIILPLPEPVTIMAGSSVFGAFEGAIIGFSGTILGIITMFMFSRFASEKLINKIFDNEKLEKFNSYVEKSGTLVILTLFIIPILPDEIICAGSGLVKINGCKFILVAVISKLITTFSLSYSLQLIKIDLNSILILIAIVILIGIIKLIKLQRNRCSSN